MIRVIYPGNQINIKFEVNGEIEVYPKSDVLTITMTGGGGTSAAAASAAPAPQGSAPPVEAAPAESGGLTVPAGTRILVRMTEAIDSRKNKVGHRFTSVLEADLAVNGKVVAPRGATVYGRLTEAKKSRRMTGKTELTIEFTDLMINNQLRPITTGELTAKSGSTGKTTARRAVRGAAIGGLISGSSGAKTGAKVGVGVSLLTRGNQVNVPERTLVEFTLTEPLAL